MSATFGRTERFRLECDRRLLLTAGIYLLCFLTSALVASVLTKSVRDYAIRWGWASGPQLERDIHTTSVPRLGGIAIYASFVLIAGLAIVSAKHEVIGLLLPARTLLSILIAGTVIFLLGVYDDLRGVGPYWKFGVQTVAALMLYGGGIGIRELELFSSGHLLRAALGLPLTVVWVLLITNAFNLIDGLDGLAAGSAFFSTAVLFVCSLFVSNVAVTLLTIALAGVILGFLRFNFYPASIFMGDSGSMFVGFILAALALCGSQKAPTMVAVAIPVIAFGFPIVDVVLAVSRRFLSGKPLFDGDRNHIHHKLLNRGLSQRGAVLSLYGVTAAFALMSLILLRDSALITLVLTIVAIGIVLGVQYLGFTEFAELQGILRRTSARRRSVANNVEIRLAIEAMNSCTDINKLCGLLKKTLRTIGFDGFRLGIPSARYADNLQAPPQLIQDGEFQLMWNDGSAPAEGDKKERQAINSTSNSGANHNLHGSEPVWELRLGLQTKSNNCIGHFSLLRVRQAVPILVDFDFLSREFPFAVANAVLNGLADYPEISVVSEKSLAAEGAASRISTAAH
jgi:UDP-GlcNAc:undecaprenyl-phosphate/decaprenyl-phosphate GlcNAc-1-phosphate transferase